MTCSRSALLVVLLSLSGLAGGQGATTPHNLRVVPNPAVAGEPITARIIHRCDETGFDTPSVSVIGNVVTVSQSFESTVICIGLPPPPPDVDIPLGAFGQGSYTLNYVLRDRISNVSTQESTQFLVNAGVGPSRNLRVVPNPAIAGQPVSARLLLSCGQGLQPATVSVLGNAVSLTQLEGPGCDIGVPPPPADVDFPLGTFAPGTYTLTYFFRSSSGALLYAESTQFGVVAAGVPALSRHWLLLLAVALGAFGLWRPGLRGD